MEESFVGMNMTLMEKARCILSGVELGKEF
jgi:hypothetical protein